MGNKSETAELPLLVLQSVSITHDTANKAVVVGVRVVAKAILESLVKKVFVRTRGRAVRDVKTQSPEARSGDLEQEREIANTACF